MKVWSKVKFKNSDKNVNLIAKTLTNYICHDNFVYQKLGKEAQTYLQQDLANKVAGILMLYYAKDYKRISDIVNKYNGNMTMNYDNKIFKIKIMLIQEKTI